jgi:pilus assembly protein CpaE
MHSLIASDNAELASRVAGVLTRRIAASAQPQLVPLELAAERASRFVPGLVVVVVQPDRQRALAALRELKNAVQTSILLVGPADDPKFILTSLHEGADEYLDESQLEEELGEALIRLRTRQAQEEEDLSGSGRIISVLGPSGGCGASVLAANLATALAIYHGSSGLVDLRLGAGDLAPLMDLKPTRSLADLCANLARVDRDLFEQFFVRHTSHVHLLAAPIAAGDCQSVSAKAVRQVLAMARRKFAYCVADLDRTFAEEQVEALRQSETVLLIIRLDYTAVRNARRALERMEEFGVPSSRVCPVVNRYGERKQLSAAQAEDALQLKIEHFIPDDPAQINGAINSGKPVVLERPSTKVSQKIVQLAASVNGHHALRHDRLVAR